MFGFLSSVDFQWIGGLGDDPAEIIATTSSFGGYRALDVNDKQWWKKYLWDSYVPDNKKCPGSTPQNPCNGSLAYAAMSSDSRSNGYILSNGRWSK